MCQFISWTEHNGKNYFLTKNELSTPRGKKLIEYCEYADDLVGHGAIWEYFNLRSGFDKECTDFTTPNRFPPEIVQALKDGLFEGMATPYGILTEEALVKFYETERRAKEEYTKRGLCAWKEYNETKWQAGDEYNEVERQAWKKYKEATQQTWEKCNKTIQQTFWKLMKDPNNRTEVWR